MPLLQGGHEGVFSGQLWHWKSWWGAQTWSPGEDPLHSGFQFIHSGQSPWEEEGTMSRLDGLTLMPLVPAPTSPGISAHWLFSPTPALPFWAPVQGQRSPFRGPAQGWSHWTSYHMCPHWPAQLVSLWAVSLGPRGSVLACCGLRGSTTACTQGCHLCVICDCAVFTCEFRNTRAKTGACSPQTHVLKLWSLLWLCKETWPLRWWWRLNEVIRVGGALTH